MPRISAALIDEHRETTRRALFDAALDLFARQGYVETTLGALADHAGIGRTTFYDYFTDKDDLLASLVEEYLPAVFETMIGEIPRSLSSRDQLATLVVAMVGFVAKDPVFGVILHRDVPRIGPDAQRRIAAAHQNLITEFASLYRTGVESSDFRMMPFDLAGRFILDVVMSGARTLIRSGEPKQRFNEVAEETARFLLGGLGPVEATRPG
jgi:AcrR family transcriptional regulator